MSAVTVPVSVRVRSVLAAPVGPIPALPELARELCVSPRTLKRHLRGEGLSYRRLLDGERFRRAIELMDSPGLSLEAIAEQLGYSSGANFSRAFRR